MISLMFHSAGLDKHLWRSQYVSEPLSCLAMQLQVIAKENYKTVFMDEASQFGENDKSKTIYLTFDDGYLDNWVHIFPLLKKLNLKATIFVTPEFVDPRDIIRPQISAEKVDDLEHDAKCCCAGFLSWPEMREMEKSGLVEIQSHALSHTWYFSGSEIVDFWRPGIATEIGGPIWMLWNAHNEFKPYYLTEAAEFEKRVAYGTPIYQHGKSLETKRYFPNDLDLQDRLVSQVKHSPDFFNQPGWRVTLGEIVENYHLDNPPDGEYETEEIYLARIDNELRESKRIIEKKLGKTVKGICWPGGAVTENVVKMSRNIGYEYFTLPSKWNSSSNEITEESFKKMIPRIAVPNKNMVKGKFLGFMGRKQFIWALKAKAGIKPYNFLMRLNQVYSLGKSFFS